MAPTKKKNTGRDSEGNRESGALDREGVPAELRPPLPQANWDLALALSRLGSDLLQNWPELSGNLHRSIETRLRIIICHETPTGSAPIYSFPASATPCVEWDPGKVFEPLSQL